MRSRKVEAKKSEEHSEKAIYRLPEWFLEHNVLLPSDLEGVGVVVRSTGHDNFCRGNPEQKLAASHGLMGDATKKFQVSNDRFLELRDMTTASFVVDEEGKLSPSAHTILIRSSPQTVSEFHDQIIVELAKDMTASLVSVDLEDLEDIGWDFGHQEPAEDSA
jgi:hypothetical protein